MEVDFELFDLSNTVLMMEYWSGRFAILFSYFRAWAGRLASLSADAFGYLGFSVFLGHLLWPVSFVAL